MKPRKKPARKKPIRLEDVPLVRLEARVAELEKFCRVQQQVRNAVARHYIAQDEVEKARAEEAAARKACKDLVVSLRTDGESWVHPSGARISWRLLGEATDTANSP